MHAETDQQRNDNSPHSGRRARGAGKSDLNKKRDEDGSGHEKKTHMPQRMGDGIAEMPVTPRVPHDIGEGHDGTDAEDHVASQHALGKTLECSHHIQGSRGHDEAGNDEDEPRLDTFEHGDNRRHDHQETEYL